METLLCTVRKMLKNKMSQKAKQLAVLALIFSQSSLALRAMVPGNNSPATPEITQGQEATKQNRTIQTQESTTQEERVTGQRRNFETAFAKENQNEAQPALTRPRLDGQYELAAELGIKDFFFKSEDCFFDITETIAKNQNNLTHPETLRESVNIILQLSIISKSYRSYLDTLLRDYTNGDQDQATRGIKVMRYIISKADPELQEEARLFNAFRQASDFLLLLNRINVLTDEEIQQGGLIDTETMLGQRYEEICQQTSRIATIRFFDKIKRACSGFFDGDKQELQIALTIQEGDTGETPLHIAAANNNPEVIIALVAALKEAFDNNLEELQNALIQEDYYENTPLQLAILNNNHAIADLIQAAINGTEEVINAQQEN